MARFSKILKYSLFAALAVLLLWLAFKETDPKELWETLSKADFRFVLLSMIMGYTAYLSRGIRWLILLDTLNYKSTPWAAIHSVAIGYFANMAVPRAGEVARCTALNSVNQIPVSKLFGTVLIERTIDFLMLLSLIGITFLTSYNDFTRFFNSASAGGETRVETPWYQHKLFYAALFGIVVLGLFFLFRSRILRHPFYAKVRGFLVEMKEGLQTIFRIKQWAWFVFHTLVIWSMYYFMVYICIYAMPQTAQLSMANVLFVMVAAGMGMLVPVPGGVGSYHYLVVLALGLLGVEATTALGFATLVHSGQALMAIVAGVVAMVYVYLKKQQKPLPS